MNTDIILLKPTMFKSRKFLVATIKMQRKIKNFFTQTNQLLGLTTSIDSANARDLALCEEQFKVIQRMINNPLAEYRHQKALHNMVDNFVDRWKPKTYGDSKINHVIAFFIEKLEKEWDIHYRQYKKYDYIISYDGLGELK